MENAIESTTPFLTIDPMISERLNPVFQALDSGDWKEVVENDDDLRIRLVTQGAEVPDERSSIKWDDANLFFLSCIELTKIGQPFPLEAGISKERFGRFPFGDGSPVTYLRNWIREPRRNPEEFPRLTQMLENLDTRLVDTSMGKGTGKLEMRGWLTNQETRELRKLLASKSWTPSAEEPLDGGCQDCAKHLLALLRAAEKRRCGVLLRVHN